MLDLFLTFLFYSRFLTFADHLLGTSSYIWKAVLESVMFRDRQVALDVFCEQMVAGSKSVKNSVEHRNDLYLDGDEVWDWGSITDIVRTLPKSPPIFSLFLYIPTSFCVLFLLLPTDEIATDTPLVTRAIFICKGRKPKKSWEVYSTLPPSPLANDWPVQEHDSPASLA